MKSKPRLGVLIATFNRPEELSKVLSALPLSTTHIDKVVVVDASSGDLQKRTERICNQQPTLDLTYVRSNVGSLCYQRNLGKALLLDAGMDFIQVLDDDTVPSERYLELLSDRLSIDPELRGVCGVTYPLDHGSTSSRLKKFAFWLIGLESYRQGSVSRAGCGMAPNSVSEQYTDWIFGCSMWRADVLSHQDYLGELPGSSLFEDVEFSIRAARDGRLAVLPHAILNHLYSQVERPNEVLYNYRFSRNRWYVINALGRTSGPMWYWISVITLGAWQLLRALSESRPTIRRLQLDAAMATFSGAIAAMKNHPPK